MEITISLTHLALAFAAACSGYPVLLKMLAECWKAQRDTATQRATEAEARNAELQRLLIDGARHQ